MLTSLLGLMAPDKAILRRAEQLVPLIRRHEECYTGWSRGQWTGLTEIFRQRVTAGETIEALIPEACAAVSRLFYVLLGLRPFDVQLVGGILLTQGHVTEMQTGEGKTLVASFPLYIRSLMGLGAHLVTVNDYLALRDAKVVGPVLSALGLSIGILQHDQAYRLSYSADRPLEPQLTPCSRAEAYLADVTYGTNHEFGFDYLRDHLVIDQQEVVQRELYFALVDEADSILIDEARTPLIISSQGEETSHNYQPIISVLQQLDPAVHYTCEESARLVYLTDNGLERVEQLLGCPNLYDVEHHHQLHMVQQMLRAMVFYRRDRDYVVHNHEICIVDEFTGRLMPGRRWSEGLHQAIEAKEGLLLLSDQQVQARITLQNFFRLYRHLAGMSGTVVTDAGELHDIYRLTVINVPTNVPSRRQDLSDHVYQTSAEKWLAIVTDIRQRHASGQPVLVGTRSIEQSEALSGRLTEQGIPHQVLNAKHHAREAMIIAQAGRRGAVTIATNMAGRGTDIMLGGNPRVLWEQLPGHATLSQAETESAYHAVLTTCAAEKEIVCAAGGLHVIGAERHDSRRIDHQLRGRAGRQGDPGSSRFYLSLEDDLLRFFGGDRLKQWGTSFGLHSGEPLESGLVSKTIQQAQVRVEQQHYSIRKQLYQYDTVLDHHRTVFYALRHTMLKDKDIRDTVDDMRRGVVERILTELCPVDVYPEAWNYLALIDALRDVLAYTPDLEQMYKHLPSRNALTTFLVDGATQRYREKEELIGSVLLRYLEKRLVLQLMDAMWQEHLEDLMTLQEGIGWRGYGHRNLLLEYKRDAFSSLERFMNDLEQQILSRLSHLSV